MKFRDLLELYKKGELPEKEKPEVEDEIDKFEALSDYVFTEIDDESINIDKVEISGLNEESSSADENEFSKNIKRHIRLAFLKMGGIVLAIVLAVILFIQFGLSPIIDSMYYNPTKVVAGDSADNDIDSEDMEYDGMDTDQISLDFKVYSELKMPLEARNNANATSMGYGKYSISFNQTAWRPYESTQPSVGGYIERGKITFYDPSFEMETHGTVYFTYNKGVSFSEELEDGTIRKIPDDEAYKEQRDTFLEGLEDYDNEKMLKVMISFKDLISFKKLTSIMDKYEVDQTWAAVKTDDDDNNMSNTLGFSFDTNGAGHNFDKEKYPHLLWGDYDDTGNETIAKAHFLSLLKYMKEQKEFLNMMNDSVELSDEDYEYVKKNDLEFYGVAAYVSKENLQKMIEDGVAYDIQTMDPGQQ